MVPGPPSQPPSLRTPKPKDVQVLPCDGSVFAYNLCLRAGYSRVCPHITLFSGIQRSAWCMEHSSLAFLGTFWELSFFGGGGGGVFNPQWVESADAKPMDMDGQLLLILINVEVLI